MRAHRANRRIIRVVWAGLMLAVAAPAGAMMGDHLDLFDRLRGKADETDSDFPPGVAPEQLPEGGSRGATLLQRYCDQCHALPAPALHDAAEWPAVVERMLQNIRSHAGMHRHARAPGARERAELLAYLQKHARRSMDEHSAELESAAGKLFRATCAQCHSLPDPRQHTAAEWPDVIKRMERNMQDAGKTAPEAGTLGEIAQFLQQRARDAPRQQRP